MFDHGSMGGAHEGNGLRTVRGRSLSEVAVASKPALLGRERTLPVHESLVPLLAEGAVVRGTTVGVDGEIGATSLALALASGPSASGAWVGVVGNDALGLAAAAEAGIDLARLILVSPPPARSWGQVVATLAEAVDVVVAWPGASITPKVAHRLSARLRGHGTVLVAVGAAGSGLSYDVVLRAVDASWEMAPGSSHLLRRLLTVEVTGRGRASSSRRGALWLPGPDGAPAPHHVTLDVGADLDRGRGRGVDRVLDARVLDPVEVRADAG